VKTKSERITMENRNREKEIMERARWGGSTIEDNKGTNQITVTIITPKSLCRSPLL